MTYFNAGNEAYKDGNYEEAIINLLKSVKYDAANAEAFFVLGDAYRKNEQKTEAIEAYKKVIELQPDGQRARRAQNHIDSLNEN